MHKGRADGRQLTHLDLSGYGFTGKSAVIDLMREIRGCAVPSTEFEFALLRCKDGLLDLEQALVTDWSPVRSCEAIRRFRHLIGVFAGDGGPWARLTRHGHHYDLAFPGFTARSFAFIDSLVDHSWWGEWPSAADFQPRLEVIGRKLSFKLGYRRAAIYQIYLAAPGRERFIAETRAFLRDVLGGAARPGDDVIVTHNAFEPFDPTRSMRFFDDARVIIVDRDPRDVYVAAHHYVGSSGRRGWGAATTGSVEEFIEQFRTYRSMVRWERDDGRVLRVAFESLVRDYDRSAADILRFIGKTPADHVFPRRHFNPTRSAAGIGCWRSFPDQRAMALIRERLPEFCAEP